MDWAFIGGMVAAIAASFKLLDYFISEEENDTLKKYLFVWKRTLSSYTFTEVAQISGEKIFSVFNAIYGEEHFSLRCIMFSCMTSILAVILSVFVFLLYWGGNEHVNVNSLTSQRYDVVIFFILINMLVDYISLSETRIIIKIFKSKAIIFVVLASIFDLILSILIFSTFFSLLVTVAVASIHLSNGVEFYIVFEHIIEEIFETFKSMNSAMFQVAGYDDSETGVRIERAPYLLGIFAWSSLFTSFIFQMYFVFFVSMKALPPLRTRLSNVLERLENSDRAVSAFGIFIAANSAVILGAIKVFSF